MKDFPFFTTENGMASLTLREIPYRGEAYIRLQATSDPAALLRDCVSFCRAAGAEQIYAAGILPEKYPLHAEVLRMERNAALPCESEVKLRPVTEASLETWRELYNSRMKSVDCASWMTLENARKALESGYLFFAEEGEALLGIAMLRPGEILGIVSAVPGSGRKILQTMLQKVGAEDVSLEVASTNQKAIRLYESFGFSVKSCVSAWYKII